MAGTPGHSGGRRQGRRGKQYSNRSDLRQAPKAAPGQTYGAAKQQVDAQTAIPLVKSNVFPPAAPPSSGPGNGASAIAGMLGGGGAPVPSLTAPTTRPNEPITAGLPTGPGPGPEALNLPSAPSEDDNMMAMLQAMYRAFPNDDIARLMASLSARTDGALQKRPLQAKQGTPVGTAGPHPVPGYGAGGGSGLMDRMGRLTESQGPGQTSMAAVEG